MRSQKEFHQVDHSGEARTPTGVPRFRLSHLPDNGWGALGRGIESLGHAADRTINVIADWNARLDRETDELELAKYNNYIKQRKTELDAQVFSTQDMVDGEEQRWRDDSAAWIKESRLSPAGRRRAEVMGENAAGTFRQVGEIGYRKYQMGENLNSAHSNVVAARDAGDLEKTQEWYEYYRKMHFDYTGREPKETLADLMSGAAANAYNNTLSGFGILALKQEQEKLAKRNSDGSPEEFPLISKKDADRLERQIKRRINAQTLAGSNKIEELRANGELDETVLRKMVDNGEISFKMYNNEMKTLKGEFAENSKERADRILVEIYTYDHNGKTADDIANARTDFRDKIAAGNLAPADQARAMRAWKSCFPENNTAPKYKESNDYKYAKLYLQSQYPVDAWTYYYKEGNETKLREYDPETGDSWMYFNYNAALISLEDFFIQNPEAKLDDAKKFVDDVHSFLSQQLADDLLNAVYDINTSTRGGVTNFDRHRNAKGDGK